MKTGYEFTVENAGKESVDELVGQKLKRFREIYSIGRKEMADRFHITEDALYRIEKGKVGLSSEYCYILANELNCDMNYLFGNSPVPQRMESFRKKDITGREIGRILRYFAHILETE